MSRIGLKKKKKCVISGKKCLNPAIPHPRIDTELILNQHQEVGEKLAHTATQKKLTAFTIGEPL